MHISFLEYRTEKSVILLDYVVFNTLIYTTPLCCKYSMFSFGQEKMVFLILLILK